MINLQAIKAYEETFMAQRDPNSATRSYWNALSIQEQSLVAERWLDGKTYQRDRVVAELNQETYGTNQ